MAIIWKLVSIFSDWYFTLLGFLRFKCLGRNCSRTENMMVSCILREAWWLILKRLLDVFSSSTRRLCCYGKSLTLEQESDLKYYSRWNSIFLYRNKQQETKPLNKNINLGQQFNKIFQCSFPILDLWIMNMKIALRGLKRQVSRWCILWGWFKYLCALRCGIKCF